jgi:alginate O-acetyltransferase complex protein AlgJ
LRQSLDALLRNDARANATRELLVKDASQGRIRLTGKTVVVWQFAMRELAVGDWKILQIPAVGNPLPATPPAEGEVRGGFFVPESGEVIEVEGIVTARSTVSRPGTVPYKDQIFSVHLSEIIGGKTPTQS